MTDKHYNSLPPGARLGKFEIEGVLGEGGFGITYKAFDTTLHQARAIKEYLPGDFAVRADGSRVRAKSPDQVDNFAWGIRGFLKEAQTLARFDHPNIVRVLDFFEQNDTAYMVMDYYAGESLQQRIREHRAARTEAQILALLRPLLQGLDVIHRSNILHLDIKPANIYIRHDTQAPVLLDFGAAREIIAQRSRSVGSVYTPGYAALEQYHESGKRGPWTDIYGLAATAYHLVCGAPPEEAPGRVENDLAKPASAAGAGRYSPEFLEAIDHAIRVFGKDRPQNCFEWESALVRGAPEFADLAGDWSEPATADGPSRVGAAASGATRATAPPSPFAERSRAPGTGAATLRTTPSGTAAHPGAASVDSGAPTQLRSTPSVSSASTGAPSVDSGAPTQLRSTPSVSSASTGAPSVDSGAPTQLRSTPSVSSASTGAPSVDSGAPTQLRSTPSVSSASTGAPSVDSGAPTQLRSTPSVSSVGTPAVSIENAASPDDVRTRVTPRSIPADEAPSHSLGGSMAAPVSQRTLGTAEVSRGGPTDIGAPPSGGRPSVWPELGADSVGQRVPDDSPATRRVSQTGPIDHRDAARAPISYDDIDGQDDFADEGALHTTPSGAAAAATRVSVPDQARPSAGGGRRGTADVEEATRRGPSASVSAARSEPAATPSRSRKEPATVAPSVAVLMDAPSRMVTLAAWIVAANLIGTAIVFLAPSVADGYDRLLPALGPVNGILPRLVVVSTVIGSTIWGVFEAGVGIVARPRESDR